MKTKKNISLIPDVNEAKGAGWYWAVKMSGDF